jgi:hypothetical protein
LGRVGAVEGIEISIKSSEHGNPHVHAWYQGHQVKIFIETRDVERGGLPSRQMKKLREWIAVNEAYLLKMWDDIVNSE